MSNVTDFQTPPDVCRYMASLIPHWAKSVLEPTPGKGNQLVNLSRYQVTAPKDYFLLDKHLLFDVVVMNPPFSVKSAILNNAPERYHKTGMGFGYALLEDCMHKSDNVIALMPWFVLLDSDVRMRKIYRYGLISVTQLPRSTFGYARIQTCILQLRRGYKGPTDFKPFEFLNDKSKHRNQLTINL